MARVENTESPYQIELHDIDPDERHEDHDDGIDKAVVPGYERRLSQQRPDEQTWNGEALVSRKRVLFARLLVCGVAVGLLWGTSLNVAKALVESAVRPPDLPFVMTQWVSAWRVQSSERQAYTTCVDGQMSYCNSNLNNTLQVALERIDSANNRNDQRLTNANNLETACVTAFVLMTSRIKLWFATIANYANSSCQAPSPPYPEICQPTYEAAKWNPICVNDTGKWNTAKNLLVDQDATAGQVVGQSLLYTQQIQSLQAATSAQMKARLAYDQQYFFGNLDFIKGNWSLNLLANLSLGLPKPPDLTLGFDIFNMSDINDFMQCVSMGPNCTLCQGLSSCQGLRQVYEQSANSMKTALYNLQSDINGTNAIAKKIIQDVNDFLTPLTGFMGSVQRMLTDVKSVCGALCNGYDLDGLKRAIPCGCEGGSGAGCGSGPTDCIQAIGYQLNSLAPNFDFNARWAAINVPSADYLWSQVDPRFLSGMQAQYAAMQSSVNSSVRGWATSARNSITGYNIDWNFIPGYEPPGVNYYTSNYSQLASDFLLQQKYSLGQLGAFDPTVGNSSSNFKSTINVIVAEGQRQGLSLFQIIKNYETPSGSLDIEPILNLSNLLNVFSLGFDYTYRVFRTLWYIVRYWSYSAVGLPMIDVRKFRTNEKTPMRVKIARLMSNPFVLVFVAIAVLFFAVIAIASVYVPILQAYVAGCVTGTDPKGTLLTQNSFVFFYNYAKTAGDRKVSDGTDQYNNLVGNICGNYGASTAQAQAERQNQMDALTLAFDTNVKNWNTVGDCLLLSTLDQIGDTALQPRQWTQFVLSDSRDPWYPRYTSFYPGVAAGCGAGGLNPYSKLDDGTFNCSVLPPCTSICGGPSKDLIKSSVKTASCASERLFHGTVVRMAMVVFVFLCWNISRSFFIDGITQLFWRSLTTEGFTFMGSCDRDGKPSDNFMPELQRELKGAIRRFERFAYVWFGVALAVHIPYIVMLSLASKYITYAN